VKFAKAAGRDLGWYMHVDPNISIDVVHRIAGTDIEMPDRYSPETREGDFWQYNFSLSPYSMQDLTPNQRLMVVRQAIQDFAPLLPLMQEQGWGFEFGKLAAMYSEFSEVPEILDVVVNQGEPPEPASGPVGQEPRQAPHTVREQVRRNVPGASQRGHDQVMEQLLSGGNPQESQKAALFRPTG
jgi:hypothetical protein